jgi:hypothetical protein
MSRKTKVENLGEALSVFIQTAEVAQKSGILSFDDAVIVKSAIDFVMALNQSQNPQDEAMPVVKSIPTDSEVESA